MHKFLFAFTVFCLSFLYSYAQTFQMPVGTGTASHTTCSGTFVDNGGATGPYSSSQNSTITFCPANPGDKIKLSFTMFDTEASTTGCRDYMDIWYGTTAGAAGTEDEKFCGPSTAGGTLAPFSIVSTSANGCLTVKFFSDGSLNRKGWEATISCVTPCVNPIANLLGPSALNLCQNNTTASFDATPSTSTQGTISRYEWDWGDGSSNNTTSPTATHNYASPGVYQVRLAVRNNNFGTDPLGCRSTNAATKFVKVMPTPDFTGTTTSRNINCGESTTLNASVTSQTKTQKTPTFNPAVVSLPDGTGASYTTALDFTGFFPGGATVTAGCYPTLKFDLEHSWARDLTIDLIAPTGQTVRVYDRTPNPGTVSGIPVFGTCVNNNDDQVPGCPATYTVVASGGTAWNDPTAVTTATTPCATYSGPCLTTSPGPSGSTIQFVYFKPITYNSVNPFTAFNGADLNGVWSLRITDNRSVDDGVLTNWSLTFPPSCYGSLETVTPQLSSAVWNHFGTGPAVPAYTNTSTAVSSPGPDACPAGVTCTGNKLTNAITVGPFPNPGVFEYVLDVTDEFGCNYKQRVNVNVTCPVTCLLNLASAPTTSSQTICVNQPITPIVYNVGGNATNVTVSGLPATFNSVFSSGVLTITGTPTTTGNLTYTITTIGCVSNLTETGTIKVNDKPTVNAITAPASICGSGSINLTPPSVTDNGSSITSQGWQIESAVSSGTFVSLSPIPYTATTTDNGKKIRYFATNSCGTTNSNEVVLTVNANPTVDPGPAVNAICQGATSTAMGGSVGGGATGGTWTGGAGTWTNANNPATATYTAGATESGSITLTLTTSGGSCGTTFATKTIIVNIGNVSANAGAALPAICQSAASIAMGGSVGGSATGGTWSGGTGTWTNPDNPATATYTAGTSESGPITLTLTTSGGSCGSTTDTKTITVNPTPTANPGSVLPSICQGATSTAMGGSVGGGATGGTWSGGVGSWTNATNPATATYTAALTESGPVTLTLTTSGGSCGTTSVTKTLTVNANPAAPVLTVTQPNCGSATGSVTVSGLPSGSWTINPGNLSGSGTTYQISNLSPGNYSYTIKDANGCTSPLSNVVTISAASAPPATPVAVTQQPDCNNPNGSITVSSPTGTNLLYILNGGTPQSSPLFDNLGGGSYTIVAEDQLTGCRSQSSVGYPINFPPTPSPSPIVGAGERYCQGATAAPLRALGQNLRWYTDPVLGSGSPSAPVPSTQNSGTTVYYVTQRLPGLCESPREALNVIIYPSPVANAGADKEVIDGNRVQLEGTASGNSIDIIWTPGEKLSNAKIERPFASPDITTVYTIEVKSIDGCISRDQVRVVVKPARPVNIPNVFSPNGDGFNDRWFIMHIEEYPDAEVQIFNRYGAKLYEVQGYSNANGWDGKMGGADLPVGPYYYIIRLNKKLKQLAGVISIIR